MSRDERKRLPVLRGEDGIDRRRFLERVGAALALAGASACTKQPPERLVPYVRQPEEVVPGRPLFYATSMVLGGYATGLLVESHTGRPIKVEGNPDHPASLGATDAFAQASVLTLYDPDRSQVITRLGRITTWDRFAAELGQAVEAERARGGAGIRILTETITSPTLADQLEAWLREFPAAKWHQHQAAGMDSAGAGARLAFGRPLATRYALNDADVVLSLDSDFLSSGPGSLRYAREFAQRRAPEHPAGMNRLYAIESAWTSTGTLADHRHATRPSEIAPFAMAVAGEIGVPGAAPPADAQGPERARWVSAVARDLMAHAGRCAVIAGEHASPGTHLLAHAMNAALGNVGRTVLYTEPVEARPADQTASLRELVEDMRAGAVTALIMLGGNPVYTAPADFEIADAMTRVPLRVHLSLYQDETSERCHFHVPEAHFLEAWGDARAFDGTASLIQPLIEPLYQGRSAHELLSAMSGKPTVTGLEVVQSYWRGRFGAGGDEVFEASWRKALHDGLIAGTALPPIDAPLVADALRPAAAEIAATRADPEGYELTIRPDPTIDDGRFANSAWLQELPKPLTKLTWDNAALISPRAAARLDLRDEDVVELVQDGRAVKAAVYVLAGQPDRVVTVHLGYGRTRAGRWGTGAGFDAYRLRTSGSLWSAGALTIRRTDARYPLALTQKHFSMEGRPIARRVALAELRAHPGVVHEMGEQAAPHGGAPPGQTSLYPAWDYEGNAWGMAIDLGACTGCSACVIACQAENNIPTVGKAEVIRSREMHWLRIDQYREGSVDDPVILNEPMLCVHCENAPCEPPCPVAATTHSADGLNEMTYNRCVGTRYCQNNCPYKVRRFNYFEYNDDPSPVLRLRRNPDVTVRSRGVMEKCTFCVQRINGARIQAKREDRRVRDGEIVTACEAACPTRAIVFGDINDPASRVRALKALPRNYAVLGELNTRPRATHLARVTNENPELGRR